jgi:hypothetical protein
MNRSAIKLYLPLVSWNGYSAFTILCHFFGFYTYDLSKADYMRMGVFLILLHAALAIGYNVGINRTTRLNASKITALFPAVKALAIILSLVYIGATLFSVYRHGLSGLARESLAEARSVWITDYQGTGLGHVVLIGSIGVPFLYILGLLYWKNLTILERVIYFALLILGFLLPYLGGARSGFYAMLVYAISALMLRWVRESRQKYYFNTRISLVFICILLLAFMLYSATVTISRLGVGSERDEYYTKLLNSSELSSSLKMDHPLLLALPRPVAPAVIEGSFYFGHSYYALAKSLSLEFRGSGFGLANSDFMVRNFERHFGGGLAELNYFYRLAREHGYSTSLWGTAYIWLASDVTFPGVVLIFGLFGVLLGEVWRSCISQGDIFASFCFIWLTQFGSLVHVAYITGDYGAFVGFYGSIFMFLRTRVRLSA